MSKPLKGLFDDFDRAATDDTYGVGLEMARRLRRLDEFVGSCRCCKIARRILDGEDE